METRPDDDPGWVIHTRPIIPLAAPKFKHTRNFLALLAILFWFFPWKRNSCGRKRKVWDFMDMLGSTSRGTGFPVVFTGKLRWEMRGYFCHLLVSRETWLRAGVQERDCDGTFLPISPFCPEKNPPTAGQGSLEDCYNLGKGFSRATSICSRVYLVTK